MVRGPHKRSELLESRSILQEELASCSLGGAAGVQAAVGTRRVLEAQARPPRSTAGLPRTAYLRSATLSLQSRSSVQQGDVDGARRLGRLARMLSITFIVMGIVIIVVAVTVNFAGEAQAHTHLLARCEDCKGCSLAPWGRGSGGGGRSPSGPQRILALWKGNLVSSNDQKNGTACLTCLKPEWIKMKGVGGGKSRGFDGPRSWVSGCLVESHVFMSKV